MFSRTSGVAAAITVGLALVFVAPLSAQADDKTSIAFTGETNVTVDYGSPWFFSLGTTVKYGGVSVPLSPRDGSVDIYLTGVGGTFLSNLPIQPGGAVYVGQPDDLALLAPGTYEVRASYSPSKDSFKKASQTSKTATLTITPVSVEPVVTVFGPNETPSISAVLGGAYVEQNGGAPPGTWHFDVTNSAGASSFAIDVAQTAGSVDPVVVEITPALEKGQNYTVSSTFTPAGDLATGLHVATIPAVPIATAGSSLGDVFAAPVPVPVWLVILLTLIAAGLAITTIVFAGRVSALRPMVATEGAVDEVELMTLDEVGLLSLDTMPIEAGQPWLLSDHDPTVGAPTELLPRPDSVDAPTELLSQADTSTVATPTADADADADGSDSPPTTEAE
jgi:hypothetical protein